MFRKYCVIIAVGVLSGHSFAQGFYADLSIGYSSLPGVENDAFVYEEDDSDISFSLLGGYAFNKYLSVEVSYQDLGGYSLEGTPNEEPYLSGPKSTIEYDVAGYGLALLPGFPVTDQLSLFARLGQHKWEADIKSRTAQYSLGEFQEFNSTTTENSDSDSFYGIGLSYEFAKKIVGKVMITRYEMKSEEIDNIAVSVGYQF